MSENISGNSRDTVVCSDKTVVGSGDSKSHVYDKDLLNIQWGKITPITNGRTTTQEHFDISSDTYVIGGNVDCQFTIANNDAMPISNIQCSITKDISNIYNPVMIEDLSSSGIFVNGEKQKFMTKKIIKSGDEVAFNTSDNKIFVFENYYEVQYGLPKDVNLRFHVGEVLGCGAYGKVFRVIDRRTQLTFAMKEILLNKPENSLGYVTIVQAKHEIAITKGLSHEHVIKFHGEIWQQNAVYMILEFIDGGDLRGFINRENSLSVKTTLCFFRQLSSAVQYLHHQQIVHCDIKPENILLTNNEVVKLSDFGLSQKLEKNNLLGTCGRSLYAAPEVHNKETCDSKIDIWSLGTVLYVMLSNGVVPFSNVAAVQRGKLDEEVLENMPKAATDLIKKMLMRKSKERLSIDEVQVHDWLIKGTENCI